MPPPITLDQTDLFSSLGPRRPARANPRFQELLRGVEDVYMTPKAKYTVENEVITDCELAAFFTVRTFDSARRLYLCASEEIIPTTMRIHMEGFTVTEAFGMSHANSSGRRPPDCPPPYSEVAETPP
ncbi:hypothetical protein M569_17357 [Genlisea aurea]|uniref:Uncharacterized protein n=1 Tax=Genlisea aurea TaxID=192259 RepID=S8BSC2_9LAMI|nr:hypothetical protein M569_17357 [Genlisea aurea]